MTIEIVVPFDHEVRRDPAMPLRRVPALPRVVFVSNGKPFVREVLRAVGAALERRGQIASFDLHEKAAMVPLDDDATAAISEGADVAVAGVGDCGGCTACSTTDAIRCLQRGTPSFIVATTKFEFLVDATDRRHGVPGLGRLYVDHPIWTRDERWFKETGERLAAELVARLERPQDREAGATPRLLDLNDALTPLRAGLAEGGYGLAVEEADAAVKITITAGSGACPECLVPADLLRASVIDALERCGRRLDEGQLTIRLPAEHRTNSSSV